MDPTYWRLWLTCHSMQEIENSLVNGGSTTFKQNVLAEIKRESGIKSLAECNEMLAWRLMRMDWFRRAGYYVV